MGAAHLQAHHLQAHLLEHAFEAVVLFLDIVQLLHKLLLLLPVTQLPLLGVAHELAAQPRVDELELRKKGARGGENELEAWLL